MHRQEQIMLEEQSKLRVCDAKTVVALQVYDSRLTGHDNKIDDMSLFTKALTDKFSKFEEKQDNVLKFLHNIDHTISEIDNSRKGEDSREAARRKNSESDPSRKTPWRHEHHYRN
ncbi:hypothetical protein OROMI_022850 [Orobanche minor]